MTENKKELEPKEKNSTLLIGLALLAAMVWMLVNAMSDSRPSVPTEDPTAPARLACVEALRAQSTYPSSFDVSYLTNPPQAFDKGNGRILVKVPYTAKNGLGNEVPLMGLCVIESGVVANVLTNNR